MKKRYVFVYITAALLALALFAAAFASAEDLTRTPDESSAGPGEISIPDDTPVTYGYFKAFREQIKREILEELRSEGGLSDYRDIALSRGDVIILSPGCELIFRGGSAVIITSSDKAGDGIKDLSLGTELFSGEAMVFGHVYTPAASGAEKAIIITGETALFTAHGEYEIR